MLSWTTEDEADQSQLPGADRRKPRTREAAMPLTYTSRKGTTYTFFRTKNRYVLAQQSKNL